MCVFIKKWNHCIAIECLLLKLVEKRTFRAKILLVFVIFLCEILSKVLSIICSAKVTKCQSEQEMLLVMKKL